jgi:hypothetical protein
MASNRYLEAIKRLLGAEAYIRSCEDAKEHKPKPPGPKDKSQR